MLDPQSQALQQEEEQGCLVTSVPSSHFPHGHASSSVLSINKSINTACKVFFLSENKKQYKMFFFLLAQS